MVKDQQYRYPRVNRAHFKPNFVKKDRDDQIDLGWAEGVFSDGRPFRLEVWAATYVRYYTYYFSIVDIEYYSPSDLKKYLVSENVIEFDDEKYLASGFTGINVSARKVADDSGNDIWEVTIIVDDDDGPYVHNKILICGYRKE